MTSNPAMALRPAEDLGHALAGHLAFLAESQPAGACDVRTGNDLHGGFARDFATADGHMPSELPARE
jgi:hypothetical protein